jgi:uncharacterized protein YecE (DUF72 family)
MQSGDRWDRIVAPRDDELAEIAPMLRRMRKGRRTVYVNINNHYEGSAPRTADKIRGLLK